MNKSKKITEHLPESTDKEFWGEDAEIIPNLNEKLPVQSNHIFKQKGQRAVCTSCNNTHGVFLSFNEEVREGRIVKRLSTPVTV